MSDDHLKLLVKFQDEARRMFSILFRSWTILLQTCIHKLFPQNEQRTLYGALVVTLATLLHIINCRFVIIIIYYYLLELFWHTLWYKWSSRIPAPNVQCKSMPLKNFFLQELQDLWEAQWLRRRSLAGRLSLIYDWSVVDMWPLCG